MSTNLDSVGNITFLTPEEMAAKLRISIRTLQQMLKEGTAPKHLKLGKRILFPVAKEGGNA